MHSEKKTRGMTLLELLLALAGTALVGATLAVMLTAVTYASSEGQDIRALITRRAALKTRLNAAIRSAHMVLDVSEGDEAPFLVLWMNNHNTRGEDRDDPQPNLSEIRRIDLQDGNIVSYKPDMEKGDTDTAYNLDEDDFETVTDNLISADGESDDDDFPAQTWAAGITSWRIDLDTDDPQSANLISYRIGMKTGPEKQIVDTTIGAASLRN